MPRYFQQKPVDESPLEELRLGRSPLNLDDPAGVAGFLFCFFPKLKTVHGQWRPAEILDPDFLGNDPNWSEEEVQEIIAEAECRDAWHWVVETVLPEFRQIRKGERKAYDHTRRGEAALDISV